MCGKDLSWSNSWRADPRERDPTLEQGKSVKSPPPGEGAAEPMWDELTAAPIPAPCTSRGEEVEVSGAKLSPGRKEGQGKHCVVPRPALSGVPRAVQAPPCAAGTVKPQAGTVPGEREAVGASFSVGELDSAKALLGLPSLLFDTSWLERQGGVEVRWGHL